MMADGLSKQGTKNNNKTKVEEKNLMLDQLKI